MTVPTPASPPPGRPAQPEGGAERYDPWARHAPGEESGADGPEPALGPGDLREALLVGAAAALAGAVLGLLWWWLAPPVPYISDGSRAFLRSNESEDSFAVDGTFAVLAAAVGLACGALAYAYRRHGGVGVVLGLASGSVLGSWVGAWTGGLLGPDADVGARAAEAGRGGVFEGPLEVSSSVLLLVWPLAALAAHLVLVAVFGPRDPVPAAGPEPLPFAQPPADGTPADGGAR
ncbi:hypothetical protein V1J52_20100 [Streptomyces sp. TRM 70351]|uniref:hypothetical protein n=1 Tax=Streptomyces sp. TRM 70351 TaxID=3116552 RepID=UPI002E7B636B|nr:hypothetical protein [Streptomyces sp. TRM 70351]MEE1930458.1 hypothetical protein [Streptomyces sp. TRM 70351]